MATKIKQTGIADSAVGQQQLAADSVTATKIVDGAVGSAEIGTGAVGADEIATGAVGADEIAAGAVGTSEIADGSITTSDIAASARPVFTKSYESPQQTITFGGTLSLAHGLGVKPKLMYAVLQNVITELNFTVGDEVAINVSVGTEATLDCGLALVPDTTNIFVRVGTNGLSVINKTNGNHSQITAANWRLVVRAWA